MQQNESNKNKHVEKKLQKIRKKLKLNTGSEHQLPYFKWDTYYIIILFFNSN